MSNTLSVCMIAKNEAEVIEDAISSARSVADEFVIGIDDSTTDGTEEIVRGMGITPFFIHWIGSFSWARNLTIDHATGTHILVMDPDERLTQTGQQFINVILHHPIGPETDRAFAFNLRNTMLNGDLLQVTRGSARLFPRHPDYRYRYSAHETITADPVYYLPIDVIDHVGFDPKLMKVDVRQDRNERMILGRILEDTNDANAWRYLAYWYCYVGRDSDAALAAGEALRLDTGFDPEDYDKLGIIRSRGSE